jgi:hypothetical protein
MFGHRIPLAETDQFESVPVSGLFYVRCDDCGQKHSYEPEEVMRVEMAIPDSLSTRPRFAISVCAFCTETQTHVAQVLTQMQYGASRIVVATFVSLS